MQKLLHLIAKASRLFHPQAGASAQVQPYKTGIHRRKKVLTQKEHPPQRQQAEPKKKNDEEPAVLDRGFQQLVVAIAEVVEAFLKPALKPPHEGFRSRRPMLVSSHDV